MKTLNDSLLAFLVAFYLTLLPLSFFTILVLKHNFDSGNIPLTQGTLFELLP